MQQDRQPMQLDHITNSQYVIRMLKRSAGAILINQGQNRLLCSVANARKSINILLSCLLTGIVLTLYINLPGITSNAQAGQAILSWDPPTTNVDETALTDLSGYKLKYGTTSGSYGYSIEVGTVTTYTLTLTDGTTYYFAVTAYDTSNNESGYSNEVSKSFPVSSDTIPPVISGVLTSGITTNGVTITWTTDEAATSQIEYGTSSSYGSTSTLDNTYVTSHSQSLTGLLSSTVYHLRVRSIDTAGNEAISSDLTFTTDTSTVNQPPVATISSPLDGDIFYAEQLLNYSGSGTDPETGNLADNSLSWELDRIGDGLGPVHTSTGSTGSYTFPSTISTDTTYKLKLTVTDSGSLSNNKVISITVKPKSSDTVPPVISVIDIINITTSDATITWTTDEAATTQIEYGTSSSYGSTSTLDNTYVTSHSQSLAGLLSSTVYHFRVKSKDAAGNEVVSNDYTFTTDTSAVNQPPVATISSPSDGDIFYAEQLLNYSGSGTDPETGNLADNSLSWELDRIGDGLGPVHTSTGSTGSYTFPSTISTDMTYELKLTVTDSVSLSNSEVISITVKPKSSDTVPPVISKVDITNVTASNATIAWTTDETATSQVEYGTSTLYGSLSILDGNLVTSHTVNLTGLNADTLYHLRVISVDQAGNQSISADVNFSTIKATQTDTPTAINDLRINAESSTRNSLVLEWTATGADGSEGTASRYDARVSAMKIIEDGITPNHGEVNFSNATQIEGVSAPEIAGISESSAVNQLETNRVYYFAIKAADEKGSLSPISNVINGNNTPPLPVTALRNGYTLISFPLVPETLNVQDLLSGIVGTTADIRWWSSNGIGSENGEFVAETNVVAGYGYFLKSDIDNAVLHVAGTEITDASRSIPLQPGWNMIGNPYSREVTLRNTYIRKTDTDELKNYEDAVAAGWIGNAIYSYNGSTYNFELYVEATLKLWQGYWLTILQDGQYEMIVYKP